MLRFIILYFNVSDMFGKYFHGAIIYFVTRIVNYYVLTEIIFIFIRNRYSYFSLFWLAYFLLF